MGGGAPFTPGKPETGNRIAFLARLRNAVLDPLLEQAEEAARKKHVGDSKIRGSGGGGGIIDEGTDRLDEAGIAGGSPSDGGRGGRGAGIMTEGMVLHGGDDDDHKAGAGGNGSAASQRKEAYAKVVFLNDVAFCAGDVVQLLTHDAAHVACGYDFQNRPGPHNVPPG